MSDGMYGSHIPVLLQPALDLLITDESGVYVDCTAGGGGHIQGILNRLSVQGRVIGIDRDTEAVAHCTQRFRQDSRVRMTHGSFDHIGSLLETLRIEFVDGILYDLGLSSHQIDDRERGFSYLESGPLDMRMDRRNELTAETIINTYSEKDLADLFFLYGEERYSRPLARKLVEARQGRTFRTTQDLSDFVRSCTPHKFQVKTLSRIFQALRIEVNGEMDQLKAGFQNAYPVLKSGGRMVVISYHSLEDRLTKRFFKGEPLDFNKRDWVAMKSGYQFDIITRRVIVPTDEEIENNSRARSAKMRASQKK